MIFKKQLNLSKIVPYGATFLFIIGVLMALVIYLYLFKTTLNIYTYTEPKLVTIHTKENYRDVVNKLQEEEIIKYQFPMLFLGRLLDDAKMIKPGRYYIPPELSPAEIIKFMATRPQDEAMVRIPDGATGRQISKIVSTYIDLDSSAFMEAFTDKKLLEKYHITTENFEGYMTPDTYKIPWAITGRDFIEYFMKRFTAFYTMELRNKTKQLGINENELVTLASIVDAETDVSSELPRVAGVYWKRLKKNMRLQADPTVLYAIGEGNRRVLYKDLLFESKYNTYLYAGLPPGPIGNPSFAAIKATLNPENNPYYFFVATGKGGHYFSKNETEHFSKVQLYKTIMKEKRRENAKLKQAKKNSKNN